jgi:hypothetical protein
VKADETTHSSSSLILMTQLFDFIPMPESEMTDLTMAGDDVEHAEPIDLFELMMPVKPKEPGLEIDYPHSEWYYDPAGDLEIVSSDGILIKLAAYRLQASS